MHRLAVTFALVLLAVGVSHPIATAQSPAAPQVELVDAPTSAAVDQPLTLSAIAVDGSAASVRGDRFRWDFGDGETATGQGVTHTYASAGTYTLTVTITDASGATGEASAMLTVSDSATLAPGDQITFAAPYNLPALPPGTPLPPAIFFPVQVTVENQSGQPLAASYAADTGTRSVLGLALPDGYVALVADAEEMPVPGTEFFGCVAADGQVNRVTCTVSASVMPPAMMQFTVTAAPADAPQSLSAPYGLVSFVGPATAINADGDAPAILVRNASLQPAAITWDGATLTILPPEPGPIAQNGYAVAVDSLTPLSGPDATAPGPSIEDCHGVAGQPGAVACDISAIPPVSLVFHSVFAVPGQVPPLAYSDDYGDGTLTLSETGTEAASGGVTVAATLDQSGAMLSGAGVVRPQYTGGQSNGSPNGFVMLLSLTDAGGDTYLYEGDLNANGDSLSGQGLWLNPAEPVQAGPWTLGGAELSLVPFVAATITPAPPPSSMFPPPPPPPPIGTALPAYMGDRLVSDASSSNRPPAEASPPVIGPAGQAIRLSAGSVLSSCGASSYQWIYGDGSGDGPSPSAGTVAHTWTAPGTYTIAVVLTDAAGARSFALTQVQIVPASP